MERSKEIATAVVRPSVLLQTLSQKLGDLFGHMLLNFLVPRNHLDETPTHTLPRRGARRASLRTGRVATATNSTIA